MQLIIKTPQQLHTERVKLTREVIDLCRMQARSSSRYAKKYNTLLYKLEKIDKLLGE